MLLVKWAIVGFGNIARNKFLPALDKVPGAELKAIVTAHPDRVQTIGRNREVQIFTNVTELEDVDVVYIATPNGLHEDQAVQCAQKGINVFCEKPAALDLSGTQRMIDTCRKYDVTFGIAHMGRFNSYNVGAKDVLKSRILGDLGIVKASFSFVNTQRNAWRYDPRMSGGGAIMDIGIHLINSLHFFREKKIKEVVAINENLVYDVEQHATAIFRFEDDVLALVDCSYNSYESVSFEFRGTDGILYVLDTLFQNSGGKVIIKTKGKTSFLEFPEKDPYVLEIKDMERAVSSHTQPLTGEYEAIEDMKVVEAWYRSAKSSLPIFIE